MQFLQLTERIVKVHGICLESMWKQAVVYRKQLQFFIKHRLKVPRYYVELESHIRQHNFMDNDRMMVRHVIHVLDSSKYANAMAVQLDDEIQRVKKNIYLMKAGLIQWKSDLLTEDAIERMVVTYLQYERQGRIQLSFDIVNSLLNSAKLVIARQVFELWCQKCRRLLRQPNVIAIDQFLYLAPNFINVDEYVRRVARRQKNKDLARQCMSTLSLNCSLIKQLTEDMREKELVYQGKQVSQKEAEIDQRCREVLENQNISVDKLRDFLDGACTSHHKYRISREDHQKSLLNGLYIRNQILKEVRNGSARLQLDPFHNVPTLLTITTTNRSSQKSPFRDMRTRKFTQQKGNTTNLPKPALAVRIAKQQLSALDKY